MTVYLNPPLETDPDVLSDDAIEYLSTNIPGWEPNDGSLSVWMIMALARIAATATDVASAVPISIFRYYGETLIGLSPIDAVKATAETTWTMVDNAGYTIPAGTNVAYRTAGDEYVTFVTTEDVVVPPGALSTAAGEVVIEAVDEGTAGNDLGPGGLELIDALAFVDTIVATAATVGGVDAESDEVYLSRLVTELRLLSPRPILPEDFASLARNIPGVQRAVAVDNYDPVANTFDNERMVAVAPVDAAGEALDAPTKADLQAYLDEMREVNFIVNIFDPTYTVVDVTFQFKVDKNVDPTGVAAASMAAVTDYLQPYNWGVDEDDPYKNTWTKVDHVYYNDIIAILYNIPGLRNVTTLLINGVADDLALAGAAPLTRPGVIDGTLAP